MAKLNVLLVEDDDAHAELLCRRLPEDLCDCRRATSFAEALRLVREEPAQVIITDLGLPDSDHHETLVRLREAQPTTPIVVLTSLDDEDFASRRVAEGAQDYLVKDRLTAETLVRSIRYSIERARHTESLNRSNSELRAFAHTVAHEIRSPASAALMALSAARELDGDASRAEFVRVAERSLTTLTDFVQDLLAFAEAGGASAEMRDIDLNAVVEAAVERSRPHIDRVGGTVSVGRLPTVRGHESQYRLLFQNLVDNAIKYRSPDRPLSLSVTAEGGAVEVTDNGLGIPEDDQPKVFEFLYRAHRCRADIEGTGVGLALCKRVMTRYGGDISVLSRPDAFTTFRLRFNEDGQAAKA